MRVLAVDMGTSSCKAGVFSRDGQVAAARRDYAIVSRGPGHAELDPEAIWLKTRDAIREAVSRAGGGRDIAAVSFSSIGEATVPVAADGRVVGPSLMAYDCRGTEYVDRLGRDFGEADFFAINANLPGPQYSLPKLMWFRDHEPERYRQTAAFLLWADFLACKMGARFHTSNSLANRTLLFDIAENRWSGQLLDWAGLDPRKFAPIVRGGDVVGRVDAGVARDLGLNPEALLVAGGHDQCCNALGCGCAAAGTTVVGMGTYETYCPVFAWPDDFAVFFREGMNIENHVVSGLYASFLHHHSGLLVDWFRRTFAPNEGLPSKGDVYDLLTGEMPAQAPRLLFLPYNEPKHWPRYLGDSGGVFLGMRTGTTRGDMFRALLEGITYFFVDVVEALERAGLPQQGFLASGGGSRSDAWMQIRADIIGLPFTRLRESEGTLAGAALLAAMAAGMYPDLQTAITATVATDRTFLPDPAEHRRYREMHGLYKRLEAETAPLLADPLLHSR